MRLPPVHLILVCLAVGIFVLLGGDHRLLAGDWPQGSQPLISPLLPTPTITPLAATTPPPPIVLADCTPGTDFVRCHDQLLAMDFTYPAFFGDLVDTQLRAGGLEGVAYEYQFTGEDFGAQAGGRSHVFAEARGGRVTDQMGFGDRSGAQICAESSGYALCQEVKSGVLLIVMSVDGQHICSSMRGSDDALEAYVIVNLPHHLAINGFGFIAQLLSPAEKANLVAPLNDPASGRQCNEATQAVYERNRLALVSALEAGTAAPDIQARYDAMLRLAHSITGPYVSGDMYAPPQPLANLQCNTTLANGSTPPGEYPSPYHHGNGRLWTKLWMGSVVPITDSGQVRAGSGYQVELPWWRGTRGSLQIEAYGQSLSGGFEAIIPAGYGDTGFQPSTLILPNPGCWRITGRVVGWDSIAELTFVLEVKELIWRR